MTGEPELTRLLYVDDDPDIRFVVDMALREIGGFELCLCASGAEALARFPDFRPQMLLVDVMMPEMDGPQTLTNLRALPGGGELPAVFVTAKVQPQDLAEYRRIGIDEVIAKPFDPLALSERVRGIWRRVISERSCEQSKPGAD